jgi:hypothetical protein
MRRKSVALFFPGRRNLGRFQIRQPKNRRLGNRNSAALRGGAESWGRGEGRFEMHHSLRREKDGLGQAKVLSFGFNTFPSKLYLDVLTKKKYNKQYFIIT